MKSSELDELDQIHKIVVIGDTSVGKTNLIYVYTKEKQPSNIMPTIGGQFSSKIIQLQDHRRIQTQIWDTAGQQQYRSISMMYTAIQNRYYRNAVGALIVFDVTNRTSYQHLYEWINNVKEHALERCAICIVGNKIDSPRRVVTRVQAQKFAQQCGIMYTETTNKDYLSVQHAFQMLMSQAAKVKRMSMMKNGLKIGNQNQDSSNCKC